MTTRASYALGAPVTATARGGDARARDLANDVDVRGPHVFSDPSDIMVTNGLVRASLGPPGSAVALAISAYRGAVSIDDALSDTLSDTLSGTLSTPAWFTMGTLTIDSPTLAGVLTSARLIRWGPEIVTLRLVATGIGVVFVSLRRGESMLRIQHGSTRESLVAVERRIRWTATTPPVGTSTPGRVTESAPTTQGMFRFVAAVDTVSTDASAFSLASTSQRCVRFGAGVASGEPRHTAQEMHHQLAGQVDQEMRVA